jgi:hypothetical protein
MKRCARVAAVVLIIIGMTSALAAQVSSTSSPHEQPAGCHHHEKKSPVRQPADYKCCVAGHDAALLRSTATSHPVSQIGNVSPLGVPLVTELISFPPSIAVTPPNLASRNAPLRV